MFNARQPGLPDFLHGQLFERRQVFLTGHLDSPLATGLTAQLMTLDALGAEPITLYIDSPDATLEAAFVLIDTLKLLRSEVRAHCLGRLGGPSVAVLAVADRRSASPNARFRLAQPRLEASGTADHLTAQSHHFQDLLRRLQVELAEATGQPLEEVVLDLRRERFLDAQEALAYGLIDEIGVPIHDTSPHP
jgi:ATP-dependent Clp protease, protease subunit